MVIYSQESQKKVEKENERNENIPIFEKSVLFFGGFIVDFCFCRMFRQKKETGLSACPDGISFFVKDYTLDTAPAASVAIARVEITEWLREEGKNSFSRAKVVRCYKGELPEEITLAQYSSSTFTCRKYPVFTAGNSFLLFLIQDDRFPQETIYSILNEYATVMDIVSYDQKEYLLSRQSYFFLNTKSLPQTEDPVLLSNLLLSLQESDPIWCEIKYETKSAALLTDVENYIEKEGCDTHVE